MSLNNSKRSLHSSSNSDTSPLKKKTKIALKRNFAQSSSSSSNDDLDIPVCSTSRRNVTTVSKQQVSAPISKTLEKKSPPTSVPPVSTRIQIQRSSSSSSDDSNGSDEIVTKKTRQRRKKPVSNERSTILKQIKSKAEEKKSSIVTTNIRSTTVIDKNNNTNHNESGKNNLNGNKKCSFQFSDDDDNTNHSTISNNSNKKKKKKYNDDDDDGGTTESYEVENDNEDKHNNTRKIKTELQEEEDEDSSPTKGKNGHLGRKNIRKIIDDKELDTQTKQAVEAELERRKRIAEKQKEYNDNVLVSSTYKSTIENEKINNSNRRLILELDEKTNEPLIEVSSKLVQQLKPHQCDGIRFLWNNVFESIDAIKNKKHDGNGCILAHCMGLGKTLQVISFIHTIFNYDKITNVRHCLVLCPINAALNWSNEFEYWLNDVEPPVDHYQLTTIKPNLRLTHLNYWYEHGGVMIMGYEMYRRLASGFGLKNKKTKAQAYKCLVDPGPDIIVADEGHILKNAQTALAKCISKIKTSRRIVLTGTPLQNNLIEYYCMVSFIKPKLLGSQQEYVNRFVNPIQNGQHRDSNEDDVRLMKRRACVLHELLTGFIDRKDYSLLKDYLPPKFEYIINIRLSDLQSTLYDLYLKQQGNHKLQQQQNVLALKKDFKSARLFADYQYLQKIWTHPFLLYPHFIDHWKKRLNNDDDLIDDGELEVMFTDEDEEMEEIKKKKKKNMKKTNTNGKKAESKKNFSGFLIDNVGDDDEEMDVPTNHNENSKSQKRTTSKSSNGSSVTTVQSCSFDHDDEDDDDEIIQEVDSDAKSKASDEDDDDKVEIVKNYRTRSRTAATKEKKHASKTSNGNNLNLDIFDTGNDNTPTNGSNNNEDDDDDDEQENTDDPWMKEMREQFWFPFLDMLPDESEFDIELGGKILLLKSILDKCAEIGDKILVFSRSLYTLNYIERFLYYLQTKNQEEYQKKCEAQRQLRQILSSNDSNKHLYEYIPQPTEWIRDQDYFRMDGSTDVIARKRYAKAFNDESNLRGRLFLISTLAGGIGINLVGSNRVIVFDASWNPSHDTQAIFRSYRFGQKKPVYIYRFLAQGTMEEKIYQRQVVKQSLSQRVIDDHQLDRHFTENDIKELYKFTPEQLPEARSITNTDLNYSIPKDHLLLDLLYDHNRWIHSYHSHDSLLENKLDEGLSEEERRKALEEYENLKRLPDARQLAAQRLQQNQLTSAAMAQLPQLQQLYLDFFRTMSAEDQQSLDYGKMLQYAYELGLTPDIQKPTTSDSNQTSKPATTVNEVVLLESDDDTTEKIE
ncbi:unnamed protein product [Adineta steineri]|uniref:Transcriptional regulator ATRX homolog n=1 Tax=Adineta steineri TaxID=433720 RepID=A0A814E0U6_9BILA|nr:unnamed protein product [Adineta steineri]